MDIPGLAEIPAKLLSQCGIVTAILVIGIVWLALQLAKTRADWEKDRAGMMKMYAELISAGEKTSVSLGTIQGMLIAVQRGAGDDD
jgi:hypothetical protein